jgi:hypothetical protein
MLRSLVPATLLGCLLVPRLAGAFCGFYVAGSNVDRLENDATTVILVREGTRTVLSMQNNYAGPPEDFALVIPVPTVLGPDDVRVLPPGLFNHVSQITAPRLVEYWEQDPCRPYPEPDIDGLLNPNVTAARNTASKGGISESRSKPSSWSASTRSCCSAARIRSRSRAGFAPTTTRFHAPDGGTQDLIVHVLGTARYEAANYDNVAIPTNIDVADQDRADFDGFYAELFDHTIAEYPGAVVTEYAWSPVSCDPCPVQALSVPELGLLGSTIAARDLTLTRLHLRYDAGGTGEDLVFRTAGPLWGGVEQPVNGQLEQGARVGAKASDMFQARYAIRHRWEGEVRCVDPRYNVWGPPPRGLKHRQATPLMQRDAVSQRTLAEYIPCIDPVTLLSTAAPKPAAVVEPEAPLPTLPISVAPPITPASSDGCAHCSSDPWSSGPLGLVFGLGLCLLAGMQRSRRHDEPS